MKSTKISIDNEKVEINLPTSITPDTTAKMIIVDKNNKLALSGISILGGLFDSSKPITANLPGLQGKIIGKTSITDFLNGVFFPSVPPSISLSVESPVRYFGGSNLVILAYSFVKNTSDILSLTINGVNQPLTSGINTGTYTTTIISKNHEDTLFTAEVTAFNGDKGTASVAVMYKHYSYQFQAADNLLTYADSTLSSLLYDTYSGGFADARQQDKTFNLTDEYSYFSYPKSFGQASFVVGGLPNTAYIIKEYLHTNPFGYTEPYYLYRSGSKGTGSIRVQLN